MIGYAMMDIDDDLFSLLNINTITEYRGLSYLMGADPGAISVANFIKYYNPDLHGPSTSNHIVGLLKGDGTTLCTFFFESFLA
jgi:hypothetical protein